MAGHNKWSQIKHKKAKTDAQKGQAFARVGREITIAVKLGGGSDPAGNNRLRLALQKAKEVNMPNDNIKRAIQKGEGAGDLSNYEEVLFEGYGPNGVAIMVDALTDNRNRTVPNIRLIFGKYGGNLGAQGAVSYLFTQKGLFVFPPDGPESDIVDLSLELGADDIDVKEDGSIEVVFPPDLYLEAVDGYAKAGLVYAHSAIDMIPSVSVTLVDKEYETVEKLIESLEADEDVQAVYSNLA
jgi:YebC/PmpR family DNA-binding regulatory protein